MEKRISSRGIIIQDDKLITIFRRKVKDNTVKEYYVIPGGGLEEGETLEDNLKRELKEELCIDIEINGFVGKRETDTTIEYYFDCKIINGVPTLGGEEKERMNQNNYYEVKELSINDINNIDLQGQEFIMKANNKEYTKIKKLFIQ